MESLDTLNKPVGDVTRDFRILPGVDHIKSLIEEDANASVAKITNFLFDRVEAGRGKASTQYEIPLIYRALVIKKLERWSSLYGYKCKVDGNSISISLRGLKHGKVTVCDKCGKRDRSLTRFLIGFTGVSICVFGAFFFGHLGLKAETHGAVWVAFSIIGGIIGSAISIACAAEWEGWDAT